MPRDPEPRRLWRNLDGWLPSNELRVEARALGITDECFNRRWRELANGPIGGRRGGVYNRDNYIRGQWPKWLKWEAQTKMADSGGATAPNFAFRGARHNPSGVEPEAKHKRFAAARNLDRELAAIVDDVNREGLGDRLGQGRAREIIGERLWRAAKARRSVDASSTKKASAQ